MISARLWLLAALMVLAACATQDPSLSDPQLSPSEAATVIVYRPQTAFHSLNPERPFLYIDEKRAGKLGVGQVITLKLRPGARNFAMRSSVAFVPATRVGSVNISLEAGQTYYLRYEYGFSGIAGTPGMPVAVGWHSFDQVAREIGEARK